MSTYNKFNCHAADKNNGLHNFSSDTLKVALTNTIPLATNTVLANITQLANGNGYTTGGSTLTITSSTQTSGNYTLVPAADIVFTATGNMGPFRYAVLYNSTAAGGPLISWHDRGASLTMVNTETFTYDVGATIFSDS